MRIIALIVISFLSATAGLGYCSENLAQNEDLPPLFSAYEEPEEFEGDKVLAQILIGQEFIQCRIDMDQFNKDGLAATSVRVCKGKLTVFFGKKSRKLELSFPTVQRLLIILKSSPATIELQREFLEVMKKYWLRELNRKEFERQLNEQQVVLTT